MSSQISKIQALKPGIKLQCYQPTCGYTWEYKKRRENMQYASCPACRHNVNVELGKIKFAESHQTKKL